MVNGQKSKVKGQKSMVKSKHIGQRINRWARYKFAGSFHIFVR